jgi:hypothetical protein
MISWTGFRQTTLRYHRAKRHAGITKYNFFRRLSLAIDAICGMSNAPLRWISYCGLTLMFASGVACAGLTLRHLVLAQHVSGTAILGVGTFFLSGVQLLTMGLLGEYIGRILIEVQSRPHFLIARQGLPRQQESEAVDRAAS